MHTHTKDVIDSDLGCGPVLQKRLMVLENSAGETVCVHTETPA